MDKVVKASNEKPYKMSILRNANGELYDDNSQDVQLLVGMPIISRVNNKKLNIVNNDMYNIAEIDIENNIMRIELYGINKEIPLNDFQKLFFIAYCITNHKVQGTSISVPYSIHEFEKYDDKMRYVSLTRATKKCYTNII